jgi:hypothetical protein
VIIAVLTGSAAAGCGSSSHPPAKATKAANKTKAAPVCEPAARTVIARETKVDPGTLTARAAEGGNAEPECRFKGPGVSVVVNIDSSPQPYQRLERAIDEASQQFAPVPGFQPPMIVPKVGLDAAWLPAESKLITTDGRSLLGITVSWRGQKRSREIALAVLVARRYLGKSIPDSAVPTGEV